MKAWQGSLGVSRYHGIVSPAYIVCDVTPEVDGWYLHHLLRSRPYIDLYNRLSVGIRLGQWDLRWEDLKRVAVHLPPAEEQRAIVAFVESVNRAVNSLIRAKRRQIELLNEQKRGIIARAVTRGLDPSARLKPSGIQWVGDIPEHWEVAALGVRYWIQLGKMLDAKRITGDALIPYLRNADVQWDRINCSELPMMDIDEQEYDRYLVRPGDLLVCEGGDVGRAAFWDGSLTQCGYQKALHRLRPRTTASECPRFLFYVMFAASKLGVFVADGNENTIAHLTAEKLRRHRFGFPPVEEQQRIAHVLDVEMASLSMAAESMAKEIELLREYRTRLIADVVTGKLDVRGVELPDLGDAGLADDVCDIDSGPDPDDGEPSDTEEVEADAED